MSRRGKKPVKVEQKKSESPIAINPNKIKVRDMRGILLSGCGWHQDQKKQNSKFRCRYSKQLRDWED